MLTPEEDEQLATYGCATMCLLRQAKRLKLQVDLAAFFESYRSRFESGKFGGTVTSLAIQMAIDLGVAWNAQASRDYEYVHTTLKTGCRGVLLFTERAPDDKGVLSRVCHCRLVEGIPDRPSGEWTLWNPSTPLGAPDRFDAAEIERRLGVFLVLS